ncbi:MAG: translation initiation factor IF-2 [Actinobacteria bacterium]|nr:translation initiation factor IF-2 [Actinomycetota bacterium]MDQ3532458.1 translation initiation factor IF-2 [Actinomycetota bacterium]
MARPRVHEVAKELGISSREVLAHLESIGQPAKSHSSAIDEPLAERLRLELSNGATPVEADATAAEPAPEPATAPVVEDASVPAPPPVPAEAPDPAIEVTEAPPGPDPVTVARGVSVRDFADAVGRSPAEIVKVLLGMGEMVTVTQSIGDEALVLLGDELGAPIRIVEPGEPEATVGAPSPTPEEDQDVAPRPPVVTVMGHVDHGKTSILDAIRKTEVTAGEAGGITQHIGAYQVTFENRVISFIDTPGHEAFTSMRARGAQVTDIVVLVVAADDGVMPQTVEALDHARAAGAPILVAVNKVDRPEADPSRVRQQLADRGLLPEEWGGETVYVDVSAKQGTNLDLLLENILLIADIQLDLKANPDAEASGVVIEANLDRGRGALATLLVKRGTLFAGDALVAGAAWGRVRAMLDERSDAVPAAGPGRPVQVLGWQGVPEAGDEFITLDDEREARRLAGERDHQRRITEQGAARGVSLQTLLAATREGEVPELNLLLKADGHGSVEALDDQLVKMDQSVVSLNVVRKGVGGISENDVTLAQASDAIVIGFNVVANSQARALAEAGGVDIRTYRVIYQAVQDIADAARGLLGPEVREVPLGQAEVRATFRVPRLGLVAGCMVLEGVIRRNGRARLVRDGTIIYETRVSSLRRFKDDVREVATGFECGIGLEGFQDVKEGDLIQAFDEQEVAR